MTKDVLVSISGLHMDMDAQIPGPDEDDVIEVVTPATYYYRNGKHYIIYDEIVEGVSDTIKNKIKISGTDSLEIMKSGLSNTHMIFEKNKKNLTYYKTLYGQMLVGLNTRNIEKETWNMDPELLEKAIIDRKEKTGKYPKAIIPVALYGMPYDCERIMVIADKYGIPVIEDAAEGMGSRYNGQVLGTFGRFGVLSFNGNKMITTSGGGALICRSDEDANNIMWHATQARDAYPYYQHTEIGYNYRMSNVCAGIGRGQMTVLDAHIAHHKHVQELYEELLADVPRIHLHKQPSEENENGVKKYDSNFWLCAATLDEDVKIQGQKNVYKEVIKTAVGGVSGVVKSVDSAVTDCQPNDNVEALRVFMAGKKVECRPVWKPMHKQPVYANAVAYTNGISEEIFKVGFCLPAGPYVTDDDVHYIVDCIKEAIVK